MSDAVTVPREVQEALHVAALAKILRREMQDNSVTLRDRSERAVRAMLAASTPVGGWEDPVAWRYPVLTARDEAVARMARAMRNGKAWPAVFQANTAEALAEDALAALEALAVIPTEGGETQ